MFVSLAKESRISASSAIGQEKITMLISFPRKNGDESCYLTNAIWISQNRLVAMVADNSLIAEYIRNNERVHLRFSNLHNGDIEGDAKARIIDKSKILPEQYIAIMTEPLSQIDEEYDHVLLDILIRDITFGTEFNQDDFRYNT